MKKEFYVSRRSVWVGIFLLFAVFVTNAVYLGFLIWG